MTPMTSDSSKVLKKWQTTGNTSSDRNGCEYQPVLLGSACYTATVERSIFTGTIQLGVVWCMS